MLRSDEKMIYEIPIYSMPQKEFERRWDKWKNGWYEQSIKMGHSVENAEKTVGMIMEGRYPENIWKYNQIVGFVEISMSTRDITFNVQKTLDTGIHAAGKKKHYIQDMMTNGFHFRFRNMTNEEIIAEIDVYLDSIECGLNKPFCLYRDTYNNIKSYIDFKKIIG